VEVSWVTDLTDGLTDSQGVLGSLIIFACVDDCGNTNYRLLIDNKPVGYNCYSEIVDC